MTVAVTIWQPWATLIAVGAKPFEFRRWAAPQRLIGQRIVIHAGSRRVRPDEIAELHARVLSEGFNGTGIRSEIAIPLLYRWRNRPDELPLASGLGIATLGKPRKPLAIFGGDSDRVDHQIWAWPLSDFKPFEPIIPSRGFQGFWRWPHGDAA